MFEAIQLIFEFLIEVLRFIQVVLHVVASEKLKQLQWVAWQILKALLYALATLQFSDELSVIRHALTA